jgi:hypothetical protein
MSTGGGAGRLLSLVYLLERSADLNVMEIRFGSTESKKE